MSQIFIVFIQYPTFLQYDREFFSFAIYFEDVCVIVSSHKMKFLLIFRFFVSLYFDTLPGEKFSVTTT